MTHQPPTRRRGRPGYDLDSLLLVAARVFNQRGYDGTSMEDLAARLGITKSAIYHHVTGKSELLRLATDRALDALFAVTEEPEAQAGKAIDRLEHLVRRSAEVLVAELPFVTLLLRVRGNTAAERRALARRREFDQLITALVTQAQEEADIRADISPALAARLLFGMVNSITEWYRPRQATQADVLATAVTHMAFNGLRTTPSQ